MPCPRRPAPPTPQLKTCLVGAVAISNQYQFHRHHHHHHHHQSAHRHHSARLHSAIGTRQSAINGGGGGHPSPAVATRLWQAAAEIDWTRTAGLRHPPPPPAAKPIRAGMAAGASDPFPSRPPSLLPHASTVLCPSWISVCTAPALTPVRGQLRCSVSSSFDVRRETHPDRHQHRSTVQEGSPVTASCLDVDGKETGLNPVAQLPGPHPSRCAAGNAAHLPAVNRAPPIRRAVCSSPADTSHGFGLWRSSKLRTKVQLSPGRFSQPQLSPPAVFSAQA